MLAGYLIARALRRDERWSYLAARARAAAMLGSACFVWCGSGAYGESGGLVQRLMVSTTFGLPAYVALRTSHDT